MTPTASIVTLADGTRLSYAAAGPESSPAVVMLPGPTDSWRSYAPVLELLPSSIRAIAVSQRGHGDSDKPATGYRVQDFADDVVPLLDALRVERAVVAGHSGSCLVARRVALDHPDRVTGLVLEAAPTTLNGDPGLEEFVKSIVADLHDPIDPAFARSLVAETSSEDVPADVVHELAGELLKVPARVWKEMFSGLLDHDDLEDLGRIAAPTLLIWGDADNLVGRAMQDTLVERLRDAQLHVYEGLGHTPRWEDAARFSGDVADFVLRVRA
ncbi:MAG TPA: alpha/beta hydrolase [Microthrixaceae bacterium]|nr:alpha/beta hydrolase [Microthrixaceae bacterium]